MMLDKSNKAILYDLNILDNQLKGLLDSIDNLENLEYFERDPYLFKIGETNIANNK